MPQDQVTEAREVIREQEKRIRTAEETKRLKGELDYLAHELSTLPEDGRVVIRVQSASAGRDRGFSFSREAATSLTEFVNLEIARLEETPDAV